MAEDEMIGHQPLGGHEFQQTPGDGESQGSLMCCSPWGCKVLDKVKVTQCPTLCDPNGEVHGILQARILE